MLVIIHAKFEVNSCCGWDFRQGGKFAPPPPLMHKLYHRHPMHNRVKGFESEILARISGKIAVARTDCLYGSYNGGIYLLMSSFLACAQAKKH